MHVSHVTINKKIVCILIGTLISFGIIFLRLTYLQVYCGEYFASRSQKNFIRYTSVASARGNILDIHKNLLATNRPVTTVHWQGTGKGAFSQEQLLLLQTIETITGVDLTSGTTFDAVLLSEKRGKKIVLVTDIDFAVLSKLVEAFPNHENIVIDTHFKRFYPYNTCCSHLVGYLGNMRMLANGQFGLEKLFDADLCGKDGSVRNVVNSVGQCISYVELEKALIGNDIQTTINIDVQLLCEKVFPETRSGSFILLNPADGAIVSLVSRPDFDPNIFLDPISYETWQGLQENNPFINRAFDASYPAGSIFKLVTISAALETGIVPEDSLWNCKGYTLFGKRKYWCARRSGHGEISIKKAVAESCNTLFFEIGKKIDIDVLADYAYKFGLGKKTNIVFPEKVGLIPSREWKLDYKGERWWPGETLSVAIGQSFLLATPIQIACMIASIFTGNLVAPRLLINEPVVTSPLDIKPDTINFLKKSMKSVVKRGTGRSVRNVKDMKIYAKTSTAQTSDFSKRKLDEKYLEHGWFVGQFQYKEYDPLVIVILVERVGAAQVATTIAKNFLIEYKKYMDSLC
ncbi:MAG TPA: penicillin-binding transpeptidase domain-containing protein [Candidatus Babeliales bacterium]|nr:penicillin-binding transpeptidase domain-containing protein [Candidatus Babeliales bacterium]